MKKILLILFFAVTMFAANFERDDTTGVVTDKTRMLIWQDDVASATVKSSYKNALAYCENLRLEDSREWRLPSTQELSTLIDGSRTPTVNQVFKHTASGGYWSKSDDSGSVVWVDFSDGGIYKGSGVDRYLFVRCVRNKNKL